jgi:1,4-dihydroxy-2-naphthoate octaprenyltransferase
MRIPFLFLAPACMAVGAGTAIWQGRHTEWFRVSLVLVGAVASHVCVNVLSEYFDFTSGLDAKTRRTPFSGGSGLLQAHPEMGRSTLILALCAMGVAACIGLYFVLIRGWLLPTLSLLALVTVVLAWKAYQGAHSNAENVPALIPSMGLKVLVNLTAPLLLALGLFIG